MPLVEVLARDGIDGRVDRPDVVPLAQGAIQGGAAGRRARDLMRWRGGIQHQLEPPAAGDSFRQAEVAGSEEERRPVRRPTPACCRSSPSRDITAVLLMEYRELSKLENTYLDTLPALVHPRHGTAAHVLQPDRSGIRAVSRRAIPNLQNIPIRRELGRDIRRGFIPREGWKLARCRLLADRAATARASVG